MADNLRYMSSSPPLTRKKHTIKDKYFCSNFQILMSIFQEKFIFLKEGRNKDIKRTKNV